MIVFALKLRFKALWRTNLSRSCYVQRPQESKPCISAKAPDVASLFWRIVLTTRFQCARRWITLLGNIMNSVFYMYFILRLSWFVCLHSAWIFQRVPALSCACCCYISAYTDRVVHTSWCRDSNTYTWLSVPYACFFCTKQVLEWFTARQSGPIGNVLADGIQICFIHHPNLFFQTLAQYHRFGHFSNTKTKLPWLPRYVPKSKLVYVPEYDELLNCSVDIVFFEDVANVRFDLVRATLCCTGHLRVACVKTLLAFAALLTRAVICILKHPLLDVHWRILILSCSCPVRVCTHARVAMSFPTQRHA